MSDPRTDSLARLAARPAADSLKSEFFRMMPAIEAALKRDVHWKDILADLARNGFQISPGLAANYAAQYRRRNRPTGEPGKPGRPRKAGPHAPESAQAPAMPVLVAENGRPIPRTVANLRRPDAID